MKQEETIHLLSQSLEDLFPASNKQSLEEASLNIISLAEQSCLMEHAQDFSYSKPWEESPNQRNALYEMLEIGFSGNINVYAIIKYLLQNEQAPSGSAFLFQELEKIKSILEEGQRIDQAFRYLKTPSAERCLLEASAYGFFEQALAGARKILSPLLEKPCSRILFQKKLSSSDKLFLGEIFVDLAQDRPNPEIFHINPLHVLSCCNASFVDVLPPSWEIMCQPQNRKTFYQMLSTLMEMGMPMVNALNHLSNYKDLPFHDFVTSFHQALVQNPNDFGPTSPTFLFLSQYSHEEASRFAFTSKVQSLTEAVRCLR